MQEADGGGSDGGASSPAAPAATAEHEEIARQLSNLHAVLASDRAALDDMARNADDIGSRAVQKV